MYEPEREAKIYTLKRLRRWVHCVYLYKRQYEKKMIGSSVYCFGTSKSTALSLRNLVSGYECERVFPAGVGPGSPSTYAGNWLSPRISRSVETRRWYGWLGVVLPGARLFRASIWCPSGGVDTREAGRTVGKSLERSIGWVRTRLGEGGGQLDRRRAGGVLNPCAR